MAQAGFTNVSVAPLAQYPGVSRGKKGTVVGVVDSQGSRDSFGPGQSLPKDTPLILVCPRLMTQPIHDR